LKYLLYYKRMKIHGKLLFTGAATVSILIAYEMLVPAMIAGITCVLLAEIAALVEKRMERDKLTCNECFYFMQNDLYAKSRYIGFCCHKQTKLDSCKSCPSFLAKTQ